MKRLILPAIALCLTAGMASQMSVPVQAAPQADAARGATLFQQRCAMCHARNGKGGKIGPDLTAVMGRKAGSATYAYSSAMKASKTVWNAATLDKYIAAPTKMIPGTKMVISVTKPEDRAAIVRYLGAGK